MKFPEFRVKLSEAEDACSRASEDVVRCRVALKRAEETYQVVSAKTQDLRWAAEAMRAAGLELDE